MVPHVPGKLPSLLLSLLCSSIQLTLALPQDNIYAPFSGAIYLVYPDGTQVTAQGTNYCPASAPLACSNIQVSSWCCPSGTTCVQPANQPGLVGCWAAGSACDGSINIASVTTVTIQVAAPPPVQQSTVHVQQTTQQVVVQETFVPAAGGYCSTVTAKGPNLPTEAAAACGTILIVNGAGRLCDGVVMTLTAGVGVGWALFWRAMWRR